MKKKKNNYLQINLHDIKNEQSSSSVPFSSQNFISDSLPNFCKNFNADGHFPILSNLKCSKSCCKIKLLSIKAKLLHNNKRIKYFY